MGVAPSTFQVVEQGFVCTSQVVFLKILSGNSSRRSLCLEKANSKLVKPARGPTFGQIFFELHNYPSTNGLHGWFGLVVRDSRGTPK